MFYDVYVHYGIALYNVMMFQVMFVFFIKYKKSKYFILFYLIKSNLLNLINIIKLNLLINKFTLIELVDINTLYLTK